jgi:phage protein D
METEQEQGHTTFVVRGFDRSHRLHRGRKTRTFLRQSDADIVGRVAREAGLRTDIEATSAQHEYVIQDNQTDFAFLKSRAARLGYTLVVEDRTLKFRRAEGSPPQAPAQQWGENLLSVRTRQTAVAQPSEVQVRGWDPATKRAIVGRASQATHASRNGNWSSAADAAGRAFGGSATLSVTDQPVATQGEADKLAQAVFDEVADDYLSVEAECRGEPALRAGAKVELKGVGRRVSGAYLITATRHLLTPGGGYQTTVYVSGRRPNSLLGALQDGKAAAGIPGVVVGIVTNNNDPERQGRVKLKFPWLDDGQESHWARVATPGAGKDRGFFALPEVEDEVLVAFEQGDISRPYVVGGLWNGKDSPPAEVVQGGKVQTRILKTRIGHVIELQDDGSGGNGFITLKTKDGHTITASDTERKLTIVSKGGNEIVISDTERSISISSKGSIQLEGPGGKLAITESGVELSSKSMLKVQANAMLDVKTSAVLNIQGSLVKIN